MSLLGGSEPERVVLEQGELEIYRRWLSVEDADALFERFKTQLHWEQSEIVIAGVKRTIPRLNAWYGDESTAYTYSGMTLRVNPWQQDLKALNEKLNNEVGCSFNSVLANYYRDGNDSVAWHSDNEPELGQNPVIASLSFGATRKFSLKKKKSGKTRPDTFHIDLQHGDLLVMKGALQHHWVHQLPKTRGVFAPRISLTYRFVFS